MSAAITFTLDSLNPGDWSMGPVVDAVVCIALIILGTIFAFVGCAIFKIFLTVSGFTLGTIIGYFTGILFSGDKNVGIIVAMLFGTAFACLSACLYDTSLFLAGGGVGIAVVLLFNAVVPHVLKPAVITFATAITAAVLGGIISVKWIQEHITVLSTTLIGSLFLAIGIDHFVGGWIQPLELVTGNGCASAICYITIGIMIATAICGGLVQYKWVKNRLRKKKQMKMRRTNSKNNNRPVLQRAWSVVTREPPKINLNKKNLNSDSDNSSLGANETGACGCNRDCQALAKQVEELYDIIARMQCQDQFPFPGQTRSNTSSNATIDTKLQASILETLDAIEEVENENEQHGSEADVDVDLDLEDGMLGRIGVNVNRRESMAEAAVRRIRASFSKAKGTDGKGRQLLIPSARKTRRSQSED